MDDYRRARVYLSRAYRLNQRIDAKLEQLMQLRSLSQRCTVAFGGERVSHTRNVTSMENVIVKIVEAEKRLDAQIDRFVDLKEEIQQTIDVLPDPDCRLLLELRYLAMKRWMDVAGEMNISRTYAHILHEKALAMLETLLAERGVNVDV